MAGVIVHATISERHRLQCFHIWVGVMVHATISERRRLQCFHIWVGVIVHATISERRILQCFHIWVVLSFMPRYVVNGIDYSASIYGLVLSFMPR